MDLAPSRAAQPLPGSPGWAGVGGEMLAPASFQDQAQGGWCCLQAGSSGGTQQVRPA